MPPILPTTLRSRTARGWALLGALLLAAAVGLIGAAPAEAASHTVTIQQYAYGPSALSVKQGGTVTWTNKDTAQHDVVVTDGPATFRSPLLSQGQSWSFTFTVAGSYSYICSIHPDMAGSVTVAALPAAKPSATPKPKASSTPTAGAHTDHVTQSPAAAATVAPAPVATATPVAPAPVAAPSPQPTTAVAETSTSLNPLLLVAGASIAVVVFCLLLLASRPRVVPATGKAEESG